MRIVIESKRRSETGREPNRKLIDPVRDGSAHCPHLRPHAHGSSSAKRSSLAGFALPITDRFRGCMRRKALPEQLVLGLGHLTTAADSCIGLEVALANGEILHTGSGAHRQSNPFYRHFGTDLTGIFTADPGAFRNQDQDHAQADRRARGDSQRLLRFRDDRGNARRPNSACAQANCVGVQWIRSLLQRSDEGSGLQLRAHQAGSAKPGQIKFTLHVSAQPGMTWTPVPHRCQRRSDSGAKLAPEAGITPCTQWYSVREKTLSAQWLWDSEGSELRRYSEVSTWFRQDTAGAESFEKVIYPKGSAHGLLWLSTKVCPRTQARVGQAVAAIEENARALRRWTTLEEGTRHSAKCSSATMKVEVIRLY